ncbi:MAG: MobF family relaxase [Pseudomonadota bacterium]
MLGLTKDTGGNTAEYYRSDNYYARGENPQDSAWLGKAASLADLSGPVDDARFNEMRTGKMPGGKAAGEKHTPGWDLTASAPKSISILGLVGKDERLIEAHRAAANEAFKYVEKHAATRVRKNGKIQHVITGNLVAGRFTHDTSRAGDPALHDHIYIFNRTKDPESGKWKALNSRALYAAKEAASRIYNAELYNRVKGLGYKVTDQDRHGNFEIQGLSEDLLKQFSKRREQILEIAGGEKRGRKTMERIALASRSRKSLRGQSEKEGNWRSESGGNLSTIDGLVSRAQKVGVRVEAIKRTVSELVMPQKARTEDILREDKRQVRPGVRTDRRATLALHDALAHVAESQAVFTESELVSAALQLPRGRGVVPARMLGAIESAKREGVIMKAPHNDYEGLTSRPILDAERRIVQQVTSKEATWSVAQDIDIGKRLRASSLSKDQKSAFRAALEGNQRYSAIVGFAGTGKSFLVRNLKETLDKDAPNAEIIAIAPMHRQLTDFKDMGIETKTISGFLAANRHLLKDRDDAASEPVDHSNTILVVDETGMNSNMQADELTQIAEKMKVGRVLFMGDPKQKSSPEQGAPFDAMLRGGIKRATMRDIRRQKTPTLKKAVYQAATGNVSKAMETLQPHITESGDQEMEQLAFNHWLGLKPAQRTQALVVATTVARRNRLNELIRSALVNDKSISASERLGKRAYDQTTLISKRLSVVEKNTGGGLEKGDILVFHRGLRGIQVEKGDQLKVTGVNLAKRSVLLEKEDGSEVAYRLPGTKNKTSHFEAYKSETLELRIGDRLTWSKSDKKEGIKAGTEIRVSGISKTHITLTDPDGSERRLDRTDPQVQHIAYGYSTTSFSSQGATNPVVIGVTGARDRRSGDEAHFYVMISRVGDKAGPENEHLAIFTDDSGSLMDRYARELSAPDSALIATNDPLVRMKAPEKPEEPKPDPRFDPKQQNEKIEDQGDLFFNPETKVPDSSEMDAIEEELSRDEVDDQKSRDGDVAR